MILMPCEASDRQAFASRTWLSFEDNLTRGQNSFSLETKLYLLRVKMQHKQPNEVQSRPSAVQPVQRFCPPAGKAPGIPATSVLISRCTLTLGWISPLRPADIPTRRRSHRSFGWEDKDERRGDRRTEQTPATSTSRTENMLPCQRAAVCVCDTTKFFRQQWCTGPLR